MSTATGWTHMNASLELLRKSTWYQMLKGDSNERCKQRTGVGCNPSNRVPLLTAPGRSLNALALRQKRVVIVGATGMVGGHALRYALGPSRRPLLGAGSSVS